MPKIDKETNFYIKLTEGLYKRTLLPDVDISEINIDKLLNIAVKDNALYYAAKKLLENPSLESALRKILEAIVSKGDSELLEIQRTIDDIKKYINDYLIFKTYRGENFERIGNDIDVFVKHSDLYSLRDEFLARGYYLFIDFPKHERAVLINREDRIKIHLQSKIHWCWKDYLDEGLIWQNPRNVIYNGREIVINNVNADFLIHIAHINYEHPYFRLSELLYLFSIVPTLDLDILLKQTKKYNWQKTFSRTMNLMNNIHQILYGELLTDKIGFTKLEFTNLTFPFMFSRKHIIQATLEKRITYYLLGRMFKIIRVLLTGETCSYTDPPERGQLTKNGKPVIKENAMRKALNLMRYRILKLLDIFER